MKKSDIAKILIGLLLSLLFILLLNHLTSIIKQKDARIAELENHIAKLGEVIDWQSTRMLDLGGWKQEDIKDDYYEEIYSIEIEGGFCRLYISKQKNEINISSFDYDFHGKEIRQDLLFSNRKMVHEQKAVVRRDGGKIYFDPILDPTQAYDIFKIKFYPYIKDLPPHIGEMLPM